MVIPGNHFSHLVSPVAPSFHTCYYKSRNFGTPQHLLLTYWCLKIYSFSLVFVYNLCKINYYYFYTFYKLYIKFVHNNITAPSIRDYKNIFLRSLSNIYLILCGSSLPGNQLFIILTLMLEVSLQSLSK